MSLPFITASFCVGVCVSPCVCAHAHVYVLDVQSWQGSWQEQSFWPSLELKIGALYVRQELDLRRNGLSTLPHELSSLGKLNVLRLGLNKFCEVPVSTLSLMTALNTIDFSYNSTKCGEQIFKVPSSLLPILHPGLVKLDLRQYVAWSEVPWKWDANSLFHLGRALVEVADRKPRPTLLFRRAPRDPFSFSYME
jgi:hypothetical protein